MDMIRVNEKTNLYEIAKLVKSKTYKHEVMSPIPGTHEFLYCFFFLKARFIALASCALLMDIIVTPIPTKA